MQSAGRPVQRMVAAFASGSSARRQHRVQRRNRPWAEQRPVPIGTGRHKPHITESCLSGAATGETAPGDSAQLVPQDRISGLAVRCSTARTRRCIAEPWRSNAISRPSVIWLHFNGRCRYGRSKSLRNAPIV